MQLSRGQNKSLAHPAIAVHAQHADVCAAVRFSSAARDAFFAVDVRFDRAAVARLHIRDSLAHGDDFNPKLVTEDARVGEKRLLAGERVNVRAANSDAMHAH